MSLKLKDIQKAKSWHNVIYIILEDNNFDLSVEEKSHETEKKDEQQMRKVEKIEDDDEFSV